jgi:hypothetical protein
VSSLLVGYCSAAKSFLDAAAIAATHIFVLTLAPKEQDLSKGKFWNTLESENAEAFQRYRQFRTIVQDIVKWRDAAVHRTHPLVMVHSPGPPEESPREAITVRVIADPDVNFGHVLDPGSEFQWMDPLALHRRWRSSLGKLADMVANDIVHTMTGESEN